MKTIKSTHVVNEDISYYKEISECDISASTSMGTAQPPASASMSWVQQTSNDVGSGDRWDNSSSKPKRKKLRVSNVKKNESANVSPYDKLGNKMLDKLKIPSIFSSTPDGGIKQKELSHSIREL